jgi:hypothetical protein
MKKLNDIEIAKPYVGKTFDAEKVKEVFDYNGVHGGFSEYMATCFYLDKARREKFGITPLLHERWGYAGIDFSVYIHDSNGKIQECHIYKCRNTDFHSLVLTPTQQEIRVFRRIMDYITERNDK